jgi:hypothetical protein
MQQSKHLCLGFTSYRPETLPLARSAMEGSEALLLEEPQTPGFEEMLSGEMDIAKYLELNDYEFPDYTYRSCELIRDLHSRGVAVRQVDPFMDELIGIHEFFISGGEPDGIPSNTVTRQVYEAEREWTKRLLAFYKASRSGEFDRIVSSVKAFARADAQRGRLRDRMRAEKVTEILADFNSVYVEAGYIHIPLMPELLRRIPSDCRFTPAYLTEPVLLQLAGRRRLLGPGDLLTLIYAFRPDRKDSHCDLLAARSLVYNQVVIKEEMPPDHQGDYPHTRDEIEAIDLAASLGYEQCRELFHRLSSLSTTEAKASAREWVRSRRI